MDDDLQRRLEVIWRRESPRVVGGLLRHVRDLGTAEQLAQDAFVAALEQWPKTGVPDNPGAWLMATAQHRAIDQQRHAAMQRAHQPAVALELARREAANDDRTLLSADEVGDDLLRLMFLCCHPVLPPETRTAMVLRLVAGLSTAEIARAYVVPEATIAQRIVRGKRLLSELETLSPPGPEQQRSRVGSVLEAIYLVFNEGYTGTASADWVRRELCDEALRLARMLAEIEAGDAEGNGLVALLEIQASRLRARADDEGNPVLLVDQDRSRWDRLLIERGLAALACADALVAAGGVAPGNYHLQAAIAACHARAPIAALTDWTAIVQHYGALLRVAPSPIVELNRAVAVAMAFGPVAGLHLVDQLAAGQALRDYHLLPSVRGDLLHKLGRFAEAQREFERAAAMTRNEREQVLLRERALVCAQHVRAGA